MKEIFIMEDGKHLSLKSGNLIVHNEEKIVEYTISIQQIDSISVYSNPHITTPLLKVLAVNKVPVHYFTRNGKYIFSTYIPHMENYSKHRSQFKATHNKEFKLEIAKKIISNKINLQARLLVAYDEDELLEIDELVKFEQYCQGIQKAKSIKEILGYEGRAAKSYFYYLSLLVDHRFKFFRRSKRPAKDPFNSMLSYGYDILYNHFRGLISKAGLHLGHAFIHKNKDYHAALASDLMEEWRAIIVDDVVMQLIKTETISNKMFKYNKNGACFLNAEGRRIFLQAMRSRTLEEHPFFHVLDKNYSFLSGSKLQIESLMRAIESLDSSKYYLVSGE